MFNFRKRNRTLENIEKLAATRQFAEAELLLKGLMEQAPHDATLQLHAAVLAFEKGDTEAAHQLILKALAAQPDNPVMHLALGEVLFKKKLYNESMLSLHKSLELSPGNPKAEYLLGLNCIALERWDEATMHFEQVAREDRDYLMARLLTIGEAMVMKKLP